jgi:hypothetical protein
MKTQVFAYSLVAIVIAFLVVAKMTQTPTVSSVQAAQQSSHHEDMTQFSNDVAKFMSKETGDLTEISADCKPNQGEYGTRCWITITGPDGTIDKATAENVRRRGDKFVWDHES